MLDELYRRHPYLDARERFMRGELTRVQAAGMVASDRDFIAECELNGLKPEREARLMVERKWCPELLRRMTSV